MTKKESAKYPSVKRIVKHVYDGDTFRVDKPVRGSVKIRIANIDTPERGKRGYITAKRALTKNILNEEVKITPKGKSYDRTVANVYLKNKKIT